MILVFDTETTGLPLFNERSYDPRQPHLVQLALVLYDESGTEVESDCLIVKPEGWVIPEEMTAIHGISHERALAEGIPESYAVGQFLLWQSRAALRVAHNESFDRRIMRIAMTRAGIERDVIEATEARPSYCTCNEAKPIVNLPPTSAMVAKGMNSPKPPKLVECIDYFFQEKLDKAHDALIDARACARLYFHLQLPRATA